MRFTAQIVSLCQIAGFLSLATASPDGVIRDPPSLVERDLATVTEVLNDVGSGIDNLDSAVKSFNGGDSGPVVDAAESLVSAINDGKSRVDDSDDLSLSDALALQDPVEDLTDKAQTLTDDLKDRKSAIQEAGLCGTTRSQITDIISGCQELIDSVVSKVPEGAQSIARELASALIDVLNDAQDAFSESNCADTGGASTSGQAVSNTAPATGTTDAGSLPSTADIPPASTTESASLPIDSTAAPVVPPTPSDGATATPSAPVVTAGAAVIAPAGALVLGMAAVFI